MKIDLIICDVCGVEVRLANCHWESRPSHIHLHCPRDGNDAGLWDIDVCCICRRALNTAIVETIRTIRINEKLE